VHPSGENTVDNGSKYLYNRIYQITGKDTRSLAALTAPTVGRRFLFIPDGSDHFGHSLAALLILNLHFQAPPFRRQDVKVAFGEVGCRLCENSFNYFPHLGFDSFDHFFSLSSSSELRSHLPRSVVGILRYLPAVHKVLDDLVRIAQIVWHVQPRLPEHLGGILLELLEHLHGIHPGHTAAKGDSVIHRLLPPLAFAFSL
jgi:hypothetical protein